MTAYRIDAVERYPVYAMYGVDELGIELTELEVATVEDAAVAFEAAQQLLINAICRTRGHSWKTYPAFGKRPERTLCGVCDSEKAAS